MNATALILNHDNNRWLCACLAGVGDGGVVYHAPGIGVYGPLKRLPAVKQPPGQSRSRRHANALQDLFERFPDAERFAILEDPQSPRIYGRAEAAAVVADFENWIENSHSQDTGSNPTTGILPCEVYPHDCRQADVLIVTSSQRTPGWWETRAEFVIDQLALYGITACAVAVRSRSVETIEHLLETWQPRVLLNRAMQIPADTLRALASRHADVNFVTVCHSSYGAMGQNGNGCGQLSASIDNANLIDNIYFAHVDERNQLGRLCGFSKFIHLPNVVKSPDDAPHHSLQEPPVVSLICVPRDLKNVTTQLLGAALAAKQRPLRIHIALRGDEPAWLTPLVDSFGLNARFVPWTDWRGHMQTLSEDVDIGLQASFTESFNYVGLEHLLCGKPVVGSPALRYLPKEWQADPDDADSIAALILEHLEYWDVHHGLAGIIGREVAERCNTRFVAEIERLLV